MENNRRRSKEPTPYDDVMRYVRRFFKIAIPVLLAAELFVRRHAWIGVDGTEFFYAWYGFASCAAIVAFSKALGALLKRPPDYYDRSPDNVA
ncbi:MAG: hypothetical protein ABW189_07585 [Rickettsiales bacterium]